MIKKVSSLLLCGLISFSLFGMGLDPNTGQPIQPSKKEKIEAYAKIISSECGQIGSYGLASGCFFLGALSIVGALKGDKTVSCKSIPVNLLIGSIGIGLWLYNCPFMNNYIQNQYNFAWQRNITINNTVVKSAFYGSALCGVVAGLYTGFKINEYFLPRS